MKKALIHLREDLQSSIGFRYAAAHTRQSGMDLQVIHVVEPDAQPDENTGWVRRSWEKDKIDAGQSEINRLLRTENIEYHQAGEPKITIGDKNKVIHDELTNDSYSIYFEGYLPKDNYTDFQNFLEGDRFRNLPCPVLIVKDLVSINNMFILVDNEVDADKIIAELNNIYATAKKNINLTVLYYKYKKGKELLFMEEKETGTYLENIGKLLEQSGWNEPEWIAVQGTPEMTSVYINGYGLVATAFPKEITPRTELVARLTTPVLLFSQ